MLRRAALFTDVPVMDAEFEYGALGSDSLTGEEAYGALGSSSLFSEEEYGDDDDDDDDDDFGALGSSSLFSEEAYGDDDDDDDDDGDDFGAWYGEDDDDDDDDFGAWYGGDDDDDDDDDDDEDIGLSDLEADIDADLYGAWYGGDPLAQRVEESGISNKGMAGLEDALGQGAVMLPQFLQEGGGGEGVIDDMVEFAANLASPGDYKEMAAYVAGNSRFANWNAMGAEGRRDVIRHAVAKAAIPGIEMTAPTVFLDAFEQRYQGGLWSRATSSGMAGMKAAWALGTGDLPRAWAAVLGDIPVTGKMATELQDAMGKPNWDDMINPTAVAYAVAGYLYPPLYDWLADSVSLRAKQAIQEATAHRDAGAGYATVQLSPATGPTPTVVQPPHAVQVAQPTLPRPQTVLAVGYALMTGGALLGVFKG